jgi:hypothetical protein
MPGLASAPAAAIAAGALRGLAYGRMPVQSPAFSNAEAAR